jgi:hypothetical protein
MGENLITLDQNVAYGSLPVTLVIIILDASMSMARFKNDVEKAINDYLNRLRGDKTKKYVIGIVTFGSTYELSLPPTALDNINEFTDYKPEGDSTLLWQTTKRVLSSLVKAHEALLKKPDVVVVGVFSDGEDNASPAHNYPLLLEHYSRHALMRGFVLQAIGIGIDGKKLAHEMGFPEEFAHTVDANQAGIHESSVCFANTTMGGAFRKV